MQVVQILNNGDISELEKSKKDLAKEFDIHFRDLRPVFSIKQVATILPRGDCFILNFGIIKLVVGRKKLYFFNLGNQEVQNKLIPHFKTRIKKNSNNNNFVFLVLELALNYKQQKIVQDFMKMEIAVTKLLKKVEKNYREKDLEKLLLLKKRLSKFEINARENESAILEILEDDEELQALSLEKQEDEEIVEEAESILESFLEQLEVMLHKVLELKENTDHTQEIITLKLHSRRNVIIRFDLFATMITGCLTFLTLITGIYGMNIKNRLEEDFSAFLYIVLGMSFFFVFFVCLFIFYFRKKKVL